MHFKFILLVGICFLNIPGYSETISGKLFRKDSSQKELLFNYKNQITEEGNLRKSNAEFIDLEGHVVLTETSEREGVHLKKYEMDHRQTGRKGSIRVDGGKITFNFEDQGKKKSPETEELKENFVVGPTLVAYVSQNWKTLLEGKTIDIRFGVWDRQETVGFSLFKVGEDKVEGKEAILLKFKPTSFIISALVDPVIFKFSKDGQELLGMVGRVAPKQKAGNGWKDLDAEVIYSSLK